MDSGAPVRGVIGARSENLASIPPHTHSHDAPVCRWLDSAVMNVSLSHISEEAKIAAVLAQWIESSLDRDVHLSGEAGNIQLGGQRLAEVDRVLGEVKVVVLLCSDRSIGRPWISFESGCAWLKKVPVVAACHSGCSKADLLPPLGSFPAFDLSDAASCQALLETLATRLERKRIPRVDFNRMVDELSAAMDSIHDSESNGVPAPAARRPSNVPEPVPARPPSAAPSRPLEVRLLLAMKRHPEFTCNATSLAEDLGEPERKIHDALNKLVHDRLLTQRASTHPSDPAARYALTDQGRSYLVKHGQ